MPLAVIAKAWRVIALNAPPLSPRSLPTRLLITYTTCIAVAAFLATFVFLSRSQPIPNFVSTRNQLLSPPSSNDSSNSLASRVRSLWLPSETLSITVHREASLQSSFFFIADKPRAGIDPIHGFLVANEFHIRRLFHHLLAYPHCLVARAKKNWGGSWICRPPSLATAPIVLDVGSNRGFYTMLAASYKHRVHAFDPQPHCESMIQTTVILNEFQHLVSYTRAFVSDKPMSAAIRARTGCTGTYPNDNHDGWADEFRRPLTRLKGANNTIETRSVSLRNMVPRDQEVALLKMDVEGNELAALRSAAPLFSERRVWNLVVEFNMPMMKHHHLALDLLKNQTVHFIQWLYQKGYAAKIHVNGPWENQKAMTMAEWRHLFRIGEEGFFVIDAWFYRV